MDAMSDPRKVQSDKEWLEKFKQQTDAQKEVERLEEVERCWELVVVENVHGTISSKTIWVGQGPCPKKICALRR
jgi:hypothetical protein